MLSLMEDVRAYAQRVADVLVDVVETARWEARISSLRDLASRAGMTHTALNKRMRRETPFNVRDLAAVGRALGVEPNELLARAVATAAIETPSADAKLVPVRPRRSKKQEAMQQLQDQAARDED